MSAPSGITYPSTSHSATHFLLTTGSGGCIRNVSFTMALSFINKFIFSHNTVNLLSSLLQHAGVVDEF
ncbi:hypothetical protein CR513_58370, partial [Mucuna pruriens]